MPDNRARIWFALFVLAVFCLGGAGGFLVGRHVRGLDGGDGRPGAPLDADGRGFGRGPRAGGPGFGRGPGGPGPGLPPPVAARLESELGLDEAQRVQFRKVLEDHRHKFDKVHREARERFESEQRELQDSIRAMLRQDQVERFDRFVRDGPPRGRGR